MTATIAPDGHRIVWPTACAVRFGWDAHNRRTVTFGPGVHGNHDVTINGVEASIGSWRWTEHDRSLWRFTAGQLRRVGTIEYLSTAAHRKLRTLFEDQVPRLAETHHAAFDRTRRGQASEHADMADSRALKLLAAARAQQDRAEVSRLVADATAVLRPCEPRRCTIDHVLEHPGDCWVQASIETPEGRIGWAVTAARSRYSAELFYLPEHLVKERRGQT